MTVYDFDYSLLDKLPVLLKERKHKGEKKTTSSYVNEVVTFDIETTNLKIDENTKHAIMYIFAVQVGDDITIYGRTWDEFRYFIEHASSAIGEKKLIIFVHNLAFEFCFLSGIFHFDGEHVFATEAHKILKCQVDNIEFRCSYFLTNLSLKNFTKQMGVENQKLSGDEFDYSKIRYPWTPLTEYEMAYMTNDVKGLEQALKVKMSLTNDDLTTLPLTSTGYVRRDIRNAIDEKTRLDIVRIFPNAEIYKLLREAFRGGNTMANRYIAGDIIENVTSYDMVSSYPNVLLTEKFPVTRFKKENLPLNKRKIKRLLNNNKAFLGRFGFGNLRLKSMDCPCPYISTSKCRYLEDDDPKKTTIWNGRIIKAEFFETTLTDIDFKIIDEMYTWDSFYCMDLYSANYGSLPKCIKDVILNYYNEKTKLKGTEEGDPEYVYYCWLKALLNACFGMMCQDPCKLRVTFNDGEFENGNDKTIEGYLKDAKWSSLPYQWGVWTSAHARRNLQNGLDLVGEDFVYCDTDSVKFTGDYDFSQLNARAEYKAERAKAIAYDKKGNAHAIGVWENEKYRKPNRFCTLGAKKYVLECDDFDKETGELIEKNALHITISGVRKDGGKELAKIENFKEGFVFEKYGKPISSYNSNVDFTIEVEGHELRITDNCYIEEGTYKLGDADFLGDILNKDGTGDLEVKYFEIDLPGIYEHMANGD